MYENVLFCGAGKFVSQGEWLHPNRIINSYEIIFVIKGVVFITENGKQYELKENEMLLLEPGLRHFGYQKSTDTSFFWVHFTNSPKLDQKLKYQNMKKSYNLPLLFRQLIHYYTENQCPESLDYLTRLILIECFSSNEAENKNRIVSEIAAWIVANRDVIIKVEQVSEYVGYNVDYISRIFKENYGKTLKEYIDDTKISYIKQLLLTSNKTLTAISHETGFSDYKYFLKYFKYHEGVTPTQFLKMYPQTHINKK